MCSNTMRFNLNCCQFQEVLVRTVHHPFLPKIIPRHSLQAPRLFMWPVAYLSLVLYVALFLSGYSWPTALDKEAFHIMSSNTPSLRSNGLVPTCYLHVLLILTWVPKIPTSQPHSLAITFSFLSLSSSLFRFLFLLLLLLLILWWILPSRVFSKQ